MSVIKKQAFHWRSFVSFYMLFATLAIAISGSVLYIAPPGRIANWSYWALGGLEKANWQAVHTIFAFLFVVAAAFHVYFNWRVIVSYLKTTLGEGIRRKRELALSSALVVGVLALTLAGVPPFVTVMSVGDDLKNSWATPASEPPVPHAEAWTVLKFSETMKIPVEEVTANLSKAGIAVPGTDVTLLDLAKQHNVTPQQVYTAGLGGAKPAKVPLTEGGGYGRKTIRQLCDELGIPVETGLQRLRAGGVEAAADGNIRELALKRGKSPVEIAKLLEGPSLQ
jgi:hypothetical protein